LSQLRELLRADTAGDPMGRQGLWTGLHLEQICERLQELGIAVSPNTVRRLLALLGYALHANRKSLSGPQSPDRDRQFHYIAFQREQFANEGLPRVSVDTKKKELVGLFKNNGRVWSQEPRPVNDHDFPSLAKGVGIPRGLYDTGANRGFVSLGISHDTAEFAVDALVEWWRLDGRRLNPGVSELLVLADTGGSNSARSRLWKLALQEKLADAYQLSITVCHYPTGASKWNPVEHRLFSEISKHCAGQPFVDHTTMRRLIAGTHTKTGLQIRCTLNTKQYATKIKVTDEQMAQLDILPHPILPQWNYTILPRINGN
jgi:hypothetical protein